MSNDQSSSTLDALSIAVRAATRLTKDFHQSEESDEKLTPEILASAIKLASLSTDYQEKLTAATVSNAIKLAKNSSNQEEQNQYLTPESLAIGLKLATKVMQAASSDNTETEEISINQDLSDITTSQGSRSQESIASEILADAIKLDKK